MFAHGVGASELSRLQEAVGTLAGTAATPLAGTAELTTGLGAGLGHLDATEHLRDLGVEVDRSALTLRPSHRSDPTAIERLARRATGPAPVTLFAANDVLALAETDGARGLQVAMAQLACNLERLTAVLRRGELPETWLVGLGSPVAVRTTFDFASAWRQRIVPPLARDLALHLATGHARIVADNMQALVVLARELQKPPFAAHGRLVRAATGTLRFVAHPGIAFAAQRLHARAPRPDEAAPVAALPLAHHSEPALDLGGVLARFWMRAVALHAPTTSPTQRRAPQVLDYGELPIHNAAPSPTQGVTDDAASRTT